MKNYFALFGVRNRDIEETRLWLESVLSLSAVARRNDHWGDYYTIDVGPNGSLTLRPNACFDEDGEFQQEPEFADWPVILYVDDAEPSWSGLDLLKSHNARLELLREEQI